MATNTASITLSGQEAEQLRKSIQDAHNHIQSAQREIDHAQGCLNEVRSLLSLRSVNDTAPRLKSPNSTIKAAPKIPTVTPKERNIKIKDAMQDAVNDESHFDGAAARNTSNITDHEQTAETIKPPRKARFSTEAMTESQNAFLRTQIGYTKKKRDAAYFLRPVNHEALNLPTYPDIIERPMDLGTVETKLRNSQYRSVQSFVDDLQLIVDNARRFNGPDHAITHAAYGVLEYMYERLETISQPTQRRKRRGSLDES
jgi:bromodomain-containing factor 1